MKKNTLEAIRTALTNTDATAYAELIDEITTELNRGAEKAQANRDLYESAHDAIIDGLSDTPVTVAELYAEIQNALPEGFTKSKVQYAVSHLWQDEIKKIPGKVNSYAKA